MASTTAFMSTFKEFTEELTRVYPEGEQLKQFCESLNTTKPDELLSTVSKQVSPFSSMITEKNDDLFKNNKVPLFDQMELDKIWNSDVSDTTKDAIWQYLNTIFILVTTISAIPKELLATIETVAEECAAKMANSGSNEMDMSSLMSGMQNVLAGLNMPAMNIAPDAPPPTPSRPKSSKNRKKKQMIM